MKTIIKNVLGTIFTVIAGTLVCSVLLGIMYWIIITMFDTLARCLASVV